MVVFDASPADVMTCVAAEKAMLLAAPLAAWLSLVAVLSGANAAVCDLPPPTDFGTERHPRAAAIAVLRDLTRGFCLAVCGPPPAPEAFPGSRALLQAYAHSRTVRSSAWRITSGSRVDLSVLTRGLVYLSVGF